MKETRYFGGKVFRYAGLFPPKFAREYAKKHRQGGWFIRLEKVRNVEIKGKLWKVAYRIWIGGSNR